jgi:hypothetical protein
VYSSVIDRLRSDWRILLYSGLLFIQTKSDGIKPFYPNSIQTRIIERIWALQQSGKPVRLLIPKARQHGVTTLLVAIIFSMTLFRENINSVVMAHVDDVATEIFAKAQLMYEYLPERFQTKRVRSNVKELKFDNHSKIRVKSAESKRQRGVTSQVLLCSEVAYYSDSEKLMTGLLQTIPLDPATMVIMESTGNGVGGYFYDMCQKSAIGENEYETVFLPWHMNSEYSIEYLGTRDQRLGTSDFVFDKRYGDEEYYQETFGLTSDQLLWRRYQIDNNFNGSLPSFMQEYPASLHECFISSGLPVFDILKLEEIERNCINPSYVGYIQLGTKDQGLGNSFIENINGDLKVYRSFNLDTRQLQKPEWRNRYICAVDTGGVWEGADYSVALIFDRVEREVVAILRGHYDSYEFAEMAVQMCKYYENACLVIEINRWSSETEDETSLLDQVINKLQYSNLYYRKIYDKMANVYTKKVGFHTNSSTKRLVVERLRQSVVDWCQPGASDATSIRFNDCEIIREMKTYIINRSRTGKTVFMAQEGCKDDRVMAMGIALVVDEEMYPAERNISRVSSSPRPYDPYSC